MEEFSNTSLIKEIKAYIKYTNLENNNCKNCKNSTVVDHPVLEREWVRNCNVAQIISFQVSDDGRCGKFDYK